LRKEFAELAKDAGQAGVDVEKLNNIINNMSPEKPESVTDAIDEMKSTLGGRDSDLTTKQGELDDEAH